MIENVVLIDDNKATNFIHSKFIRESEHVNQVHFFQAGANALEFLNEAKEFPELIFLDINMPTMDAWEFLEEYRKLESDENTKIFLLTTTISPEDERRFESYPEVTKMLFKPLSTERINSLIENYFLQKK